MLKLLNTKQLSLVKGGQNTNAKIKNCIIKNSLQFCKEALVVYAGLDLYNLFLDGASAIDREIKASMTRQMKIQPKKIISFIFCIRALMTIREVENILATKSADEAQDA